MKKFLLLSAVLGVAAVAANAEATYSSNVVGYVNTPIVAGWNMIANPLDAGTNTLNALLQGIPNSTTAMTFANGAFTDQSVYDADFEEWSVDYEIAPGTGLFVWSAEATTYTFVGEVFVNKQYSILLPAGWSLVANPIPVAGTLDEIGLSAAVESGDYVMTWNAAAQGYNDANSYDADFEEWSAEETIDVGQAFFINKANESIWTSVFTME